MNGLVRDAVVANVRTERIVAASLKPDMVKSMQVKLDVGWVFEQERGEFRYSAGVVLLDTLVEDLENAADPDIELHVAEIQVSIVVGYDFPGMRVAPTQSECEDFVQRRGLNDATPYIREAVNSIANRLGHPNVTLGALPEFVPATTETESTRTA